VQALEDERGRKRERERGEDTTAWACYVCMSDLIHVLGEERRGEERRGEVC